MTTRHIVSMLLLVCGANAFQVSASWKQEAEKKHGRVAMLALPALVALGANGVEQPVSWLSQQPVDVQAEFFATAGLVEAAFGLPRLDYGFTLKEGVEPGVYPPLTSPDSPQLDAAETTVGRVAMLVTAGMLAQTLFFA